MATIPAERVTCDAERTRLARPGDPGAWAAVASAWQELGCPHRAAYAWWRQAQAQLDAELYISPKTAGVHVSNILRRFGVSGRAHAAALAERAGLLDSQQA